MKSQLLRCESTEMSGSCQLVTALMERGNKFHAFTVATRNALSFFLVAVIWQQNHQFQHRRKSGGDSKFLCWTTDGESQPGKIVCYCLQ